MRLPGVGVGVAALLAACSGGNGAAPPLGDGPQRVIDAPSSSEDGTSPPADAWQGQTLISNDWSANGDGISCAWMYVHQDMWIDKLRSSTMTEENDHQFLILSTDQTIPTMGCSRGRPLGGDDELLYGAGLGENEVDLPPGMAVHVAPQAYNHTGSGALLQTYLVLYDHLSGAGSGTSSVEVHTVAQSDVQHDVDLMLAGEGTINVTGNDQPQAQGPSTCFPAVTAGYEWNVVALWPHMHDSGKHQTVNIVDTNNSDTTTTLFDAAYNYQNESTVPPLVPATIGVGDDLEVTCTLASSVALTYGELAPESAGNTVCWTGIYKWPTGNDPSTAAGLHYGPETCVQGSPNQAKYN